MSLAEYELSEQSLDSVSDWLENSSNRRSSPHYDYHHYTLRPNSVESLQTSLTRCFAMQSIPVVFSNCHETLLDVVDTLPHEGGQVGVLNISKVFGLKASDEVCYGSGCRFLLSRHPDFTMTYLGIDDHHPTYEQERGVASELKCQWQTLNDYQLSNRDSVTNEVNQYLTQATQSVLVIDLDALHPKYEFDQQAINLSVVLNTIEQCIASDKLRLVMLVGRRDNAIYSRQTKAIYQQIKALSAQVFAK